MKLHNWCCDQVRERDLADAFIAGLQAERQRAAKLVKAVKRLLDSEVLKSTPLLNYSEAYADLVECLAEHEEGRR